MLFGFFPAQVLHAVARLGIADELAGGARTVAELAAATGTDEPSLYRLLRSAASLGLVAGAGDGRFGLTAAGEGLRSDDPGSIRNLAMLFCGDGPWRSWGQLEFSVRTGTPAYERILGRTAFEYMAEHPEEEAIFNAAMAEGSRAAAPAVVATCDLAQARTVADIGGGNGTLIAVLLGANPHLRGILFDTIHGAEQAPELLAAAGVADRCEVVTGDFFAAVPEGCDVYVLKSVIHDWDDERSTTILANCRAAMPADGTLLLVEPIMPTDAAALAQEPIMLMSDLNMLVCTGGKERTSDEFRTLLDAAGFALQATTRCPPPTSFSVLTATRCA